MKEIRIVAFGNSVTNASNLPEELSYRKLVEHELRRRTGRDIRVINAGVNSDITTLALQRIERDVLSHRPHIVTVMFGVNDAGFFRPDGPPADTPRVAEGVFRGNLIRITERIRGVGATPVLVTPLPMSPGYPLADLPAYVENGLNYLVDRYAEIVRSVASDMRLPLIDAHRYFSDHPETQEFLPDGIHPDRRGHETIANLFVPVLAELIAGMG